MKQTKEKDYDEPRIMVHSICVKQLLCLSGGEPSDYSVDADVNGDESFN